jgi:hypothetical protein
MTGSGVEWPINRMHRFGIAGWAIQLSLRNQSGREP